MKKDYNHLFNSLGFYIGHTGRAMKNSMTKCFIENGYDITSEQWGLLMFLWIQDGLTQQEISSKIMKEKTTVVRLIDNLVKHNIIVRKQDSKDRRNNLIYLTKEGKRLREKLIPLAVETLKKALNGLTDVEIEALSVLLRKVYDNIKFEQY
jgi:DNA-binding MarR family transcriptional regulator